MSNRDAESTRQQEVHEQLDGEAGIVKMKMQAGTWPLHSQAVIEVAHAHKTELSSGKVL